MTKQKILVLFAHPRQDRSEANTRMAAEVRDLQGVTFVDLYGEYPRYEIDVDREQQRLVDHDVLVFQFPMFWYSTPAILKEWQDLVLEYGFAYGHDGHALDNKIFLPVITTGGSCDAFSKSGYQNHNIIDLLRPLEQTFTLCRMITLPPFVLFAAGHAVDENRLEPHTRNYARLLGALRDGRLDLSKTRECETLEKALDRLLGEEH